MSARCPVCGVIYLSGSPDSLNMQQRTRDTQTKCYDTNCYAKSSLEIDHCNLDKITCAPCLHLPVMLYGSDCWTVKKADVQRTDALDQWCLWRILDIHWNDSVRNDVVCRMTQQPQPSSVVKFRRLSVWTCRWNEWVGWRQSKSVCATAG